MRCLPRFSYRACATLFLTLPLCLWLLAGCNENPQKQTADNPAVNPANPIPTDDPLGAWAGLRIGMNQLELSQLYNAPEGRGEGFMRTIQMFGDVTHQTVTFDKRITLVPPTAGEQKDEPADGEEPADRLPRRTLVLSFYRDELYSIVDRREGFTTAERDEWFAQLTKNFGADYRTILPTSNWRWGDDAGLRVDFAQDNAAPEYLSGRLWICHMPTYDASLEYLELWMKEHPEQFER